MNPEKLRDLAEKFREFADTGIRDILGEPAVGPVTGYAHIISQLREMFIMAVCGAGIAFFFEVYESMLRLPAERAGDDGKKRKLSPGILQAVFDFLFCIMAALVAARFWYISSCGRISFHETAALAAGIFAGKAVFLFKNSEHGRALAAVYVIMLIVAYIIVA